MSQRSRSRISLRQSTLTLLTTAILAWLAGTAHALKSRRARRENRESSRVTIGEDVVDWRRRLAGADDVVTTTNYKRTSFNVPAVDKVPLHAWLFLPTDTNSSMVKAGKFPVVVMAHGFSLDKTFGLEPYANAFAGIGVATVMFDYRGFGYSGTTPGQARRVVAPMKHVEDYKTIINHIASTGVDKIDGTRIALWGTSYSGGHSIYAAATASTAVKPNIKGVIALRIEQRRGALASSAMAKNPAIKASTHTGITEMTQKRRANVMEIPKAASKDIAAGRAKKPPVMLKTFGNMDEVAFVHSPPEELAFYDAALIPKPIVTDYENAIPARSFRQGMGSYNPINVISKVTAKMLLLGAKNDNINRYPQLQAAYKRVKGGLATLLTLDANHFACYNAPITDITYPAMLRFLNETLA